MQRPFYAFGALLLALTLTMLAINAGGRAAVVRQQLPQERPGSATSDLPQREVRKPRFCSLVVSLPADEDEILADAIALINESPCYATGCGLDRATGEVYPRYSDGECDWQCPGALAWPKPAARPMQPVRLVQAVRDPTTLRDETSRDCLSHYDPAYDGAVYSDENPEADVAGARSQRLPAGVGLDFRSHYDTAYDEIVYSEAERPRAQHGVEALLLPADRRLGNARTLLIGLANQLMWKLEKAAGLGEWIGPAQAGGKRIDWNDYSRLLDESLGSFPLDSHAAESTTAVRSSGWLGDFTATSLHGASDLLESV
ncbi:MAG TPA: hypothetical protein VFV87_09905, partial [Pirellulaceae bacterium]|nr:hypothetical protein [Pirellulaceae bacterium]